MKNSPTYIGNIDSNIDKNWYYNLNVDQDTETNCEKHGCDEICRCGHIVNAHVVDVNINSMVDEICSPEVDDFTKYCVNRVLTAAKIYKPDAWEIHTCNGYYGEEIEEVVLPQADIDKIKKQLDKIAAAKTDKEKLFTALEAEYGYILPILKDRSDFAIEEVYVKDIEPSAELHYRKVMAESNCYQGYKGIIGVVIPRQGRYRLIDGFHRFCAIDKSCEKVDVIMGKGLWEV